MVESHQAAPLGERSRHLLQVLVEQHIREGQPVGSRNLARTSGLGLSPATVRNVMGELEEQGYISAPHTSAGRIPTDRGYRLFVDRLLGADPSGNVSVAELREQLPLDADDEPQELVESVSSFLSGFTRMAGVVTLPRREILRLRHLEFLPLGECRVLVILVVNDHEVQNRVIHTDRDYDRAELDRASNYLNQRFGGRTLDTVRADMERELHAARRELDRMMNVVVEMAGKAFAPDTGSSDSVSDFVLAGETNLMNYEELSDLAKLKALFETFNRKRDLYDLLERCARAEGLQIYIGRESGQAALDDVSIVTAPYSQGAEMVGVLGVIGPTRMEYDRVIPVVDVTSRLLGAALNSRS